MTQFALSWNAYKNNICQGLCSLQQNEEFVDMTIAADGHYVKVHQLVMSLVSPYIRDLIRSAGICPHPVILLNRVKPNVIYKLEDEGIGSLPVVMISNPYPVALRQRCEGCQDMSCIWKVSYPTLVAILEYVYTGEVRVTQESLPDLMMAAKELKIKGLEDMEVEVSLDGESSADYKEPHFLNSSISDSQQTKLSFVNFRNDSNPEEHNTVHFDQHDYSNNDQSDGMETDGANDSKSAATIVKSTKKGANPGIQYTVSNQGSLQMILNRYMYYLRYTSRKGPNGHRRWLCVNHTHKKASAGEKKCLAAVITKGNVVIKRLSAHNHPFHDQKILKKVRENAVYTAIEEAESFGQMKKSNQE